MERETKSMKIQKNWAIILTVIAAALLTACGKAQTPEVNEPPVETAAQTTPVEVTEETTEPTEDANAALTNIWSIMDNECVEEIPILPGLLLDDIKGWMKETEYKEIKLYQRTNWRTVRLGVYGDMAMAQVSVDDETLVWNIRMEKSDSIRDTKTNPLCGTHRGLLYIRTLHNIKTEKV